MSLFYTGYRQVTKGRSSADNVHIWKGTVAVYSNWSLMNSSNLLDGAPNSDHDPGSGNHPHGLTLSRRYQGLDTLSALDNSGEGERVDGARFRPLEYKGLTGAKAFSSTFGHTSRVTDYSQWDAYDDSERFLQLSDPGHVVRGVDAEGTAATFGSFGPNIHKGVGESEILDDAGEALPEDALSDYGHNRINEWRGVPSTKAINV